MRILSSETVHATAIAIGGRAVLLSGPSGSGKSDLALRLIDRGARLISDDYVLLVRSGGGLVARAPATIAGKMEVRHLGIVEMPHIEDVAIALVVQLDATPERMPDPDGQTRLLGTALPAITLVAAEASAPIKVELALARIVAALEKPVS